jgi:transposase-like protein
MRTQNQWKALLEEFNNSGLTRAAFCKKHRIATSSLYRWQQLFNDHAGDASFIDVTEPLSNVPMSHPVPVRDNDWQVELELGAGIVLRLRTT